VWYLCSFGGFWERTPDAGGSLREGLPQVVGVTEPVESETDPWNTYREDQRGGAPMRSEAR